MKISPINRTNFKGVINIPIEKYDNQTEAKAINTESITYMKANQNGTTIKYFAGEFDKKNGYFYPDIPTKEGIADSPVDINTILNAYNAAKNTNLYINLDK